MKNIINVAIALTVTLFASQNVFAVPMPAQTIPGVGDTLVVPAQAIQFQIGISDGMVFGVLSRSGYSDIQIIKRKLTKSRAVACRAGIKYKVDVHLDGNIRNIREIGRCRSAINVETARGILRQEGFRRIRLVAGNYGFIATACRGNRRFRVSVGKFGGIGSETVLGRCGDSLTRQDIVAMLRAQGYSRIRAEQAQRGNFTVRACWNNNRVRMLVGTGGAVLRRKQIGRCNPPIHPATIPAILARKGFTRIDVIDRLLPRYVARACRGTKRLEISLNRFGRIFEERQIGRCEPPLSAAALAARLDRIGYDRVRIVEDDASGFVAEVCEEGTRFRLELTRYGETVSQTRLGECPTRRVGKILKQLEREGLRNTTIFVDGCRKKKRYRIVLDRYGSIVARNVTGRCR